MTVGRLLVFLVISLTLVHAKVFTRCQLTRELLKINIPRTFLSNWVCLIEQESDRNTAALVTKSPRRKYYGLYQIGSEWCKEGRKGGKCDISCEALLDDDIRDDSACALKVFEKEGFKYWSKWELRCKGHNLPDIEKLVRERRNARAPGHPRAAGRPRAAGYPHAAGHPRATGGRPRAARRPRGARESAAGGRAGARPRL